MIPIGFFGKKEIITKNVFKKKVYSLSIKKFLWHSLCLFAWIAEIYWFIGYDKRDSTIEKQSNCTIALAESPSTLSWFAEIRELRKELIIWVVNKGNGLWNTFGVFHNLRGNCFSKL